MSRRPAQIDGGLAVGVGQEPGPAGHSRLEAFRAPGPDVGQPGPGEREAVEPGRDLAFGPPNDRRGLAIALLQAADQVRVGARGRAGADHQVAARLEKRLPAWCVPAE